MGWTADDYKTLGTIYASVVGTASLVWTILRDRRDRPHLKVEGIVGTVYAETVRGLRETEQDGVLFTLTNTGRRPVTITTVGGETTTEGRHFLFRPRNSPLPTKLEEGEQLQIQGAVEMFADAASIHAIDSTGRRWPMAAEMFATMKADAEKRLSERAESGQPAARPSRTPRAVGR